MQDAEKLIGRIRRILTSQRLAVLSTYGGDQPYASLVAFTATDDLQQILFATTRSTRKYANLSEEDKVALLIDTRRNRPADFTNAVAVTAIGEVREAPPGERQRLIAIHTAKHPALTSFLASPTCALLVMDVRKYYFVSHFQDVREVHLR